VIYRISPSLQPLFRRGREAGSPFARTAACLIVAVCFKAVCAQAASDVANFVVVEDTIPQPLTATKGDAARGRAIVANRQMGLCLLCHSGPIAEERFQGNLAPSLAGAGSRSTAAQLRLRLVDSRRVNHDTIMPSYFKSEGYSRVGATWQSRTILNAQQIEDVVAYLVTLK
jgi:sulfur-oxidizing protein SoxX